MLPARNGRTVHVMADTGSPVSVRLAVRLLATWVALAAAFALTVALFDGVEVDWEPFTYLGLALLWGVVDLVIAPVVKLLALPLTIVTLGLFSLVVNGAMLALTAWLSPRLGIDDLWTAIGAALVLGLTNALTQWLLDRVLDRGTSPQTAAAG